MKPTTSSTTTPAPAAQPDPNREAFLERFAVGLAQIVREALAKEDAAAKGGAR